MRLCASGRLLFPAGGEGGGSNWKCMTRALKLLEWLRTGEVFRAVVLQELTSVCRLEYGCAKAALKAEHPGGDKRKILPQVIRCG